MTPKHTLGYVNNKLIISYNFLTFHVVPNKSTSTSCLVMVYVLILTVSVFQKEFNRFCITKTLVTIISNFKNIKLLLIF